MTISKYLSNREVIHSPITGEKNVSITKDLTTREEI